MKKRYVKVVVALVMVAVLLLASCAPTEAPPVAEPTAPPEEKVEATPKPTAEPGEPKELTIITLTGPRYQFATEGMAEEFNKIHDDIQVTVESFPHEEYVGRMAMEVAGLGTTYDIVWIDYKFIGGYADAGFLLPIDKYLEQDADFWEDFQGDVYPTILNMYQYKDNWYALPNDGNTEVFFYRSDVLEEAGVEPPKTWDDVLEVAPQLNNPPDMYAVCGNFARFWATDFWLSLFYSQDKQVWDENYVPQMESEEAIWAAEAFLELAQYAPPEAVTWEEADVYEAMGSAGICAMAPAQWGGSVLTNPELSRLADQIGVTVVPSIDEAGEMRVLPMGGFGMGINANSPYQDEAWEYIKFHVGRENQQMLVGYTGQPARTSALTDPVNVEMAPYFPALGENLQYAKPRPVIAEYAQAEQIIGVELNEMLLGNKTAAEAMQDANELVKEVLVESGKLVEAPEEEVELTIITLTGPRYQFATEGMAEEFNKTHPGITMNVESFPHEEYVGRMAMEVAGLGTTYDVVWIDYKFIGGYADAGFLLPIDEYLEQDADFWEDFQGDVYPTILNMYQYKDNWYALPNDGNTEVFFYRKDILEEAGVEPPKTWDEVLEVAPQLNNPPDMYAICGNFARFWATDFWLSLFYSQDKQVWDENFEPQMESEESIWAAEAFLELAEYAPPEAVTWEEADVYEAMGSAGICAMAPAQWGGSVLTNPELSRLADQIGVTVVPSIDEAGEMRVLPMGGFGMGINANSAHQDEAWEYIKFHVDRENQQMLVGYTGQPARTSALTDPVNVEIAPYFPALGENLQYAKPRPVIAEYAQAEQIIGVELNEMLLGNKTAAEAMKDANELVREVLIESGKLEQ